MPDIERYKLPESTAERVVLRGHDAVGPKVARAVGVLLILASLYPIYYAISVRQELGALGAAVGAWLVAIILLAWAHRRARHPDRKVYVDLAGQRLWTSSFDESTEPLAFAELGTLKLGKVSSYDARHRTSRSIQAVTFSRHEGYILYVPWTGKDMVRFVNALRDLVGEEFIPRATPKK